MPVPAWWSPRWAGGTATTGRAAAVRRPRRSDSPSWGTRRPSTTTAWRSSASPQALGSAECARIDSPDQAVVLLGLEGPQHGVVQPPAREVAAAHGREHRRVSGLLVAHRP